MFVYNEADGAFLPPPAFKKLKLIPASVLSKF
jgi:hypothetical protein